MDTYVDVEAEGQPTEEPPADTRRRFWKLSFQHQAYSRRFLRKVTSWIPRCQKLPETRPRQPESEPGSEPVDRNVRPRLAPDQEVTQLDEVENSQSTTQARGDVGQAPDEAHVDNQSGAASSIPLSLPLVSASNFLTVLPVETEFDSKAQAVVHGSVDTVTGQNSTTFEAIEGMAVFDDETRAF